MALHIRDQIIGNQLFFVREGVTVDSVTVSAAVKPDTDPTTNWITIGTAEKVQVKQEVERLRLMSPQPGAYGLKKTLTRSKGLTLTCTIQELSELFYEMLFLAQGGAAGAGLTADYVPLSGDGIVRGWLKVQQYDQDNVLRNVVDLWVELTTDDITFDDNLAKWPLKAAVLKNALNTGTLSA